MLDFWRSPFFWYTLYIELLSHQIVWQVDLILDNFTFNYNSLLEIVYVSFSMQFPRVEEYDFDRQFLFDEYVAISHRYDLKRVSLKS
jgi:hypothetical protein